MGLEGVAPIGAEEQQSAAGPQHPDHFPHGLAVVLYVFDDLVAQNQVEGVGGEGQGFSRGLDHGGKGGQGLARPVEVVFQAQGRPGPPG